MLAYCNGFIINIFNFCMTISNSVVASHDLDGGTVNSPMYDTHMSTPGNTAKPRAAHSSIQTAQRGPSLVGSEPTMH